VVGNPLWSARPPTVLRQDKRIDFVAIRFERVASCSLKVQFCRGPMLSDLSFQRGHRLVAAGFRIVVDVQKAIACCRIAADVVRMTVGMRVGNIHPLGKFRALDRRITRGPWSLEKVDLLGNHLPKLLEGPQNLRARAIHLNNPMINQPAVIVRGLLPNHMIKVVQNVHVRSSADAPRSSQENYALDNAIVLIDGTTIGGTS